MASSAPSQTAPAAISSDPIRRVYIIDDHTEIRRSLHFLLSTAGITTWPFANAADFLDQLPALIAAPILLDLRMPGIGGIELLERLAKLAIDWPVIVMTAHGDVGVAVSAMKLGAIEFLEKPFDFETLHLTLDHAFATIALSAATGARGDQARARFESLTRRESEVIRALMAGAPNKRVAHLLSLSTRTVEMHRANALAKLAVRSVAEVVALAAEANFAAQRGATA